MFTPPFAKIPLKFITINNPETQHEKEHAHMHCNNVEFNNFLGYY